MKREEFLSKLGIGFALACGGCLTACSKNADDILMDDSHLLKADIRSELAFNGQTKIADGIILARIGVSDEVSSFVATETTSNGKAVIFNPGLFQFEIPSDGAEFNLQGILTYGSASTNLKMYKLAVQNGAVFVYAPAIAAPLPPPVNFNLNLSTDLLSVGDSKTLNSVIVVRTAAGNVAASFSAVQAACTHQGTIISYDGAQGQFVCPNHGSLFTQLGDVVRGPANKKLKQYKVSVSQNILTVTEP